MANKKTSRAKQSKTTRQNPEASAPVAVEASATAGAAKPVGKTAAKGKRRGRRGAGKRTKLKAPAKAAAGKKSPKSRTRRGKRYTPAEKAKILAAARAEGLTGAQVAERFGVSTLSYYTWRKKAGAPKRRGRKPGRPARPRRVGGTSQGVAGIAELVRRAVRAQLDQMLPQVLQSELDSALSGFGDRRSRRR
jgi:transposase-like protein